MSTNLCSPCCTPFLLSGSYLYGVAFPKTQIKIPNLNLPCESSMPRYGSGNSPVHTRCHTWEPTAHYHWVSSQIRVTLSSNKSSIDTITSSEPAWLAWDSGNVTTTWEPGSWASSKEMMCSAAPCSDVWITCVQDELSQTLHCFPCGHFAMHIFPSPAPVVTFSFTPEDCNYNRLEANGKLQTPNISDAKEKIEEPFKYLPPQNCYNLAP